MKITTNSSQRGEITAVVQTLTAAPVAAWSEFIAAWSESYYGVQPPVVIGVYQALPQALRHPFAAT